MSNQSKYVRALEEQSKRDAGDAPVVLVPRPEQDDAGGNAAGESGEGKS